VKSQDITGIELKKGSIINDRYVVESVLGSGGFGIVYRCHDKIFEKTVAIKEFLPAEFSTRGEDGTTVVPRTSGDHGIFDDGVRTFLTEARRLHGLRHDNIVEITDFVQTNGTGYLVMPYHRGKTLGDLLTRGDILDNSELIDLVDQVLTGLDYVHEAKLLHRDISPGNLFIKEDGTVLLIDFGASRQAIGERSQTLSTIVKPGYAPFEQYHARGNQGAWTDLYALGATLYRCITGSAPAVATERMDAMVESEVDPTLKLAASEYASRYSPELLRFVDELLMVRSSARPQSAAEARDLLTLPDMSPGQPPAAVPPSHTPPQPPSQPPSQPPRSGGRRAVWIMCTAAIVAAAGVAYWFYVQPDPSTLTITTSPSGALAEARSDEETVLLGQTPQSRELAPGLWNIVVSTEGYVTVTEQVELVEGEIATIDIELVPEVAYLIVRSNVAGDTVMIDGLAVGPSGPSRHEVSPGTHTVTVSQDNYSDWGQSVSLAPGEERELVAELVPEVAYLIVRSNVAGDTVTIDGLAVGPSGPSRHEVSPGTHAVTVSRDNYSDWEQSVSLAPGEERELVAELVPEVAYLIVRSNVADDIVTIDGLAVGPSGPSRHELSPGTHTVAVFHEYYWNWEQSVSLAPGEERELVAELVLQPNSCSYAFDNECDEPDICPIGTDTADCSIPLADSCIYANDGECDEPGLCAFGTDTTDCFTPDPNSCFFANDGECDEPNICSIGTDSADCAVIIDFGDNSGRWANDGECDDPRFVDVFGSNMASTLLEQDMMRDAADCRNLYNQGLIRLR